MPYSNFVSSYSSHGQKFNNNLFIFPGSIQIMSGGGGGILICPVRVIYLQTHILFFLILAESLKSVITIENIYIIILTTYT